MKKLLVLLMSVLCVLSLCACSNNSSSGSDSTPADSGNPSAMKIGGSGPLTGGAAIYGIDVRNAAQLAVDEINAAEGYDFFELKFEDDEADPEKSPAAYGVLKDWGMQVSLFTVTSGAGAAVAPDYDADYIFAITPSGSNTALVYSDSTNYKTNFQVCFTDPNQGTGSADYISGHALGSKVAVIYRNDDAYSTSIYETFMAEAAVKGLDVVYEGTFIESDTDFSTQLQAAEAAGADVVFLPIYYAPAAQILTQANNIGYAPVFFGVDGMDGILGLEGFDVALAEGVYLLTPFAADATDDATVHFVTAFEAAYGSTPTQFAADAYDTVYAIYQAAKTAGVNGDSDPTAITDAMIAQFTSMTFEGLTGTATWAENGEVSKSPKAVIITDGVYVSAE
ncbi:MAG: ABC transporter substrate-binding protein [Erysipelotrichaceae bacterium]|nr:ABC transporter substrate-binding protein [Erysipelotrichaceae bacterium]